MGTKTDSLDSEIVFLKENGILISGYMWVVVTEFELEIYHKIIHTIEVDISVLIASI